MRRCYKFGTRSFFPAPAQIFKILPRHTDVAKSSHQSSQWTKIFFPSLPMATNDNLEELSSTTMHKQVRPLSPTGSVGEVVVLIGDYTQLLDATNQELYMLDWWIHGLGGYSVMECVAGPTHFPSLKGCEQLHDIRGFIPGTTMLYATLGTSIMPH
ncbi:hypothetical protein SELMODRAFT_405894 [Selaginella moellendorffii]|uniref:Uncharacterized protein n=1 Tax=Selaginella moellendorffii TaxID=88036 RepID=D8R009_SELML|nr:hypothetical protein SELMODRAFT_405894 [Selaginella moellendorffii]